MFNQLGNVQKIGLFFKCNSINQTAFNLRLKRSFMRLYPNLFKGKKNLNEPFEIKCMKKQPQNFSVYVRQMSKFTSSTSNTKVKYLWRFIQVKLLKPKVLIIGVALVAVFLCAQDANVASQSFLKRAQSILGTTQPQPQNLELAPDKTKANWKLKDKNAAVYAIQGYRPYMEDRFVISHNINNTGVSIYAIFDGHGGEFAASYAAEHLVPNLGSKITKLKRLLVDKNMGHDLKPLTVNAEAPEEEGRLFRRVEKNSNTDNNNNIVEQQTSETDLLSYIVGDKINYKKLLNDEILAVDRVIVDIGIKKKATVGSTALIALVDDNNLMVANVGDSRGVMCDGQGNTVPLSYDHKPNDEKEKSRIETNGGFVSRRNERSCWRVNGRLALSRALGDYPFKENNVVIAEPDTLVFDLKKYNPSFLVLASDGLWDEFSNEETVSFIKQHIHEPDFGAKSLTLAGFNKGSRDNITVMVINFKKQGRKFFWN